MALPKSNAASGRRSTRFRLRRCILMMVAKR
jgi:hypothetical protein